MYRKIGALNFILPSSLGDKVRVRGKEAEKHG